MHLIIDGYNLIHAGLFQADMADLELDRRRLIDYLSAYQRQKSCRITIVFDGWKEGWLTEQKERQKGIDLVFSKRGEKADEVIKRMVREKGAGVVVVTSDREISRFAERMSVPVIPSEQFLVRAERAASMPEKEKAFEDKEEGQRKKGPSKRLSKKVRRARMALKKL